MKVVILVDSLIRGGAERQALLTLRELVRRGIDARLIFYYESQSGYDWPPELNARVILVRKDRSSLRFIWLLARYLRRERIDVVHGFKDSPGIYASLCGWLAGVPVRIIGHRTQSLPGGVLRIAFRFMRHFATAWIGNAQAVTAVLKNDLGVPANRLLVVSNGIETDRFRTDLSALAAREHLQIAPNVGVVTMVAVMRAGKNHRMFIRMAARVLKQRPDTVFLLVGDSDPSEPNCLAEIQAEVKRAGLTDSIRFLGTRTDVPEILRATDVSVLTTRFEGLSNALLESMAAGVSIVATDYIGARELLQDGVEGFLVPLDDDRAMAEHVMRLLGDSALRAKMGRAGMERVDREFSMQAMGDRLIEIYSGLLASPGADRATAPRGNSATKPTH